MDSDKGKETRKQRVIKLTKTLKRIVRPATAAAPATADEKESTAKIDLKPSGEQKTSLERGMPPKRFIIRGKPKTAVVGTTAVMPEPVAAAAAPAAAASASSLPSPPYNEQFIKVLGRLNEMLLAQGDVFRARAYKKAQETILGITRDITNVDELKGLPGIGATIIEKLNEYVRTGTLALFEREKENPIYILTGVYGIGPKKAEELVKKHSIRTITELREREAELLNDKQRIGLKYYEDILKRIPRAEIDSYQHELERAFRKVALPTSRFEIVGSYRRGARESGDIDVIVTDDTGDVSVFVRFLDELRKSGIVIETLSEGKSKSLAISRLEGSPARRIDFLFAPPQEYAFAVLYFTGSASFNVVMRQHALNRGYTLSEHGIHHVGAGGKGAKVDVIMPDERAIFDFLGLVYKKPQERIDGRAVVLKTAVSSVEEEKEDAELAVASALMGDSVAEAVVSKTDLSVAIPELAADELSAMEEAKLAAMEAARAAQPKKTIKRTNLVLRKGEKQEPAEASGAEGAEETGAAAMAAAPAATSAEPLSMPESKPAKRTLKIKSKIKEKVTEVNSIETDIQKFKERGVDHLDSLTVKTISEIIATANDAYYNKVPLLTDSQYDIIKEYLEKRDPTNPVLKLVGAPIKKDKIKLPFFMGSMDKIKPDTGALLEWKERFRGPYVLTAKLDGISGLYIVDPDGTPHLYTRGDGSIGQDITHVIPYLNLPRTPGVAIRGELIMTKLMFKTIYADTGAANSRNLVAGILNRKTRTPDDYRNIDFVAYEVITPAGLKPSAQMEMLATETIDRVASRVVARADLTNELLSEMLIEMREGYDYEIDGIIVSDDAVYPRKAGNPEHAFAFKMLLTDQIVEAKVVDVLWAASKDGYLKPRVRIEPVVIGGATIEYATAFNGAFVEDNKIGVGAVVRLVRSGDVIPHILSVEVPAPTAKMPDVAYRWNDTHVDVMLKDGKDDAEVRLKVIASFLKTLSVDGAGEGNVARMMKAGYDTIPKVLSMSVSDYMKVEGFGEKLATKIQTGISKAIETADLPRLMDATNIFGRGMGERRIREVTLSAPDILTSSETATSKVVRIMSIKGFAKKTAEQFVENIPAFLTFLEETGLSYKLSESATGAAAAAAAASTVDTSHPLYGKTIVMTGFRDKELAGAVEAVGGKVGDSVSKNTAYVVLKDLAEDSGKANKARELGIPLILVDDFKKLL